jgi:hypothetical protein
MQILEPGQHPSASPHPAVAVLTAGGGIGGWARRLRESGLRGRELPFFRGRQFRLDAALGVAALAFGDCDRRQSALLREKDKDLLH